MNEIVSELSAANIAAFSDINLLSNESLSLSRKPTLIRKETITKKDIEDPKFKLSLVSPKSDATDGNSDNGFGGNKTSKTGSSSKRPRSRAI